jgi:hypothetical protein
MVYGQRLGEYTIHLVDYMLHQVYDHSMLQEYLACKTPRFKPPKGYGY